MAKKVTGKTVTRKVLEVASDDGRVLGWLEMNLILNPDESLGGWEIAEVRAMLEVAESYVREKAESDVIPAWFQGAD